MGVCQVGKMGGKEGVSSEKATNEEVKGVEV